MSENMDTLRQEAERFGLSRLTEQQLTQFARAKASAERFAGGIPRNLQINAEPAHTFHADKEAES